MTGVAIIMIDILRYKHTTAILSEAEETKDNCIIFCRIIIIYQNKLKKHKFRYECRKKDTNRKNCLRHWPQAGCGYLGM